MKNVGSAIAVAVTRMRPRVPVLDQAIQMKDRNYGGSVDIV